MTVHQLFLYFTFLSHVFSLHCGAGSTFPSRAPGLTSGLQGSVNVHRDDLLLVPQ